MPAPGTSLWGCFDPFGCWGPVILLLFPAFSPLGTLLGPSPGSVGLGHPLDDRRQRGDLVQAGDTWPFGDGAVRAVPSPAPWAPGCQSSATPSSLGTRGGLRPSVEVPGSVSCPPPATPQTSKGFPSAARKFPRYLRGDFGNASHKQAAGRDVKAGGGSAPCPYRRARRPAGGIWGWRWGRSCGSPPGTAQDHAGWAGCPRQPRPAAK